MQARKSLKLPMPRDLRSSKLGDIQDYFEKLQKELDTQYRKLYEDVKVLEP